MIHDKIEDFGPMISLLLVRLASRHSVKQLFLFGKEGEPFWAARRPIHEEEMQLLSKAIDDIQEAEVRGPKPFIGHDDGHRYTFAAIATKQDLYLVCLELGPIAEEARARMLDMSDDFVKEVKRVPGLTL